MKVVTETTICMSLSRSCNELFEEDIQRCLEFKIQARLCSTILCEAGIHRDKMTHTELLVGTGEEATEALQICTRFKHRQYGMQSKESKWQDHLDLTCSRQLTFKTPGRCLILTSYEGSQSFRMYYSSKTRRADCLDL